MSKNVAYFSSHITKAISDEDDSVVRISGYANTIDKDRAGDVIEALAWKSPTALNNFKKNPIILFGHDYNDPAGKAVSMSPTEMGLSIEADIYKDLSPKAYMGVKLGVLKTFSVGFRIVDAFWNDSTKTFHITDLELFEVSIVAVPCNQDSTFEISKSMDSTDFKNFEKQFKTQQEKVNTEIKTRYDLLKAICG